MCDAYSFWYTKHTYTLKGYFQVIKSTFNVGVLKIRYLKNLYNIVPCRLFWKITRIVYIAYKILICAPITNFWLYDWLLALKRHFLSERRKRPCTERSRWILHTAIETFLSLYRKESLNISYDVTDISRLVIRLYFENCCFGCGL